MFMNFILFTCYNLLLDGVHMLCDLCVGWFFYRILTVLLLKKLLIYQRKTNSCETIIIISSIWTNPHINFPFLGGETIKTENICKYDMNQSIIR